MQLNKYFIKSLLMCNFSLKMFLGREGIQKKHIQILCVWKRHDKSLKNTNTMLWEYTGVLNVWSITKDFMAGLASEMVMLGQEFNMKSYEGGTSIKDESQCKSTLIKLPIIQLY